VCEANTSLQSRRIRLLLVSALCLHMHHKLSLNNTWRLFASLCDVNVEPNTVEARRLCVCVCVYCLVQ
jgi:hypothetical protein